MEGVNIGDGSVVFVVTGLAVEVYERLHATGTAGIA